MGDVLPEGFVQFRGDEWAGPAANTTDFLALDPVYAGLGYESLGLISAVRGAASYRSRDQAGGRPGKRERKERVEDTICSL